VIIGGAESVLRREEIGPLVRESVEEMRRAAERSAGLTRQLLAFARQQTVIPVVVNLNAAVESSLRMLRRLVGEDITLNWRASDMPLTVSIDPVQVDQILANLAVNARDAISGVGAITIFTEWCSLDEVTAHGFHEATAGAYARLCVEDTGCGMDEATLARIFEPFFTTKPTGEGTGLGLATVYGIVKQNGGFVDVHSTPGEGTVFCLCLPIVEKPVAVEPVPVKAVVGGDTGTILVVEDEPAIAHMVEKFLQIAGYTVLVAGSPAAALARVEQYEGDIDLLLADVVMPGMSGRDLALTLTGRIPGLRCLFMSGYTADIIAHRGQIDASIAFLSKPFTSAELLDKVRTTMATGVER
jgi:CheY-like chemotaxis protein